MGASLFKIENMVAQSDRRPIESVIENLSDWSLRPWSLKSTSKGMRYLSSNSSGLKPRRHRRVIVQKSEASSPTIYCLSKYMMHYRPWKLIRLSVNKNKASSPLNKDTTLLSILKPSSTLTRSQKKKPGSPKKTQSPTGSPQNYKRGAHWQITVEEKKLHIEKPQLLHFPKGMTMEGTMREEEKKGVIVSK